MILNIVTIHMCFQRNLPSRETFMADIAFIWAFLGVCFACQVVALAGVRRD